MSKNLELPKLAFEALNQFGTFSPKASMLVNGYSEVHKQLENLLTEIHGFEDAIILGSGFLANFSMIESLVRKGDELFIDSEYHASGMVATKLLNRVSIFKHNSIDDLEKKLLQYFGITLSRHQIDSIDDQLVYLLAKRFEIVKRV